MNFELKQHFQIESARFLPNLDKNHPCSNMHGHSFKIILSITGPLLPEFGWVIDYHEITKVMSPILTLLDHKVLNDVPGLLNPTSEHLAKWLFENIKEKIPQLKSVNISETSNTECIYPAQSND